MSPYYFGNNPIQQIFVLIPHHCTYFPHKHAGMVCLNE